MSDLLCGDDLVADFDGAQVAVDFVHEAVAAPARPAPVHAHVDHVLRVGEVRLEPDVELLCDLLRARTAVPAWRRDKGSQDVKHVRILVFPGQGAVFCDPDKSDASSVMRLKYCVAFARYTSQ